MINYIIKLTLYTVIIFLLGLLISNFIPQKFVIIESIYILLFFYLITIGINIIMNRTVSKNIRQFNTWFMGITTIKLLSFLVIVLVYSFFNREKMLPFIGTFFSCYILYTIFETVQLLKLVKTEKNS